MKNEVFQVGLMASLLDGVYEGTMRLDELLRHGDHGLGTFDSLDGEMIVVDGIAYQMLHDGSVREARPDQMTPFAVVTHFQPEVVEEMPQMIVRADASEYLDELSGSQNFMYALRIVGDFEWVHTRTVRRQERPYPPMVEATEGEEIKSFEGVSGIIAGFRTPVYERGISVPGCHVHFIDQERSCGGHVIDFKIKRARVEIAPSYQLHLQLPRHEAFARANLAPEDLDAQIKQAEKH